MAAGPAANPAEERFVSGQPADNLEEECARDRDVHGAVLSGGRDAGRHRQRVPPRSPSPLFSIDPPPAAGSRRARDTEACGLPFWTKYFVQVQAILMHCGRSEERRVGKEGVSTFRTRGPTDNEKKQTVH